MRLSLSKAALARYCVWPFAPGRPAPERLRYSRPTLIGHAWHGVVGRIINTGDYDPMREIRSLGVSGEPELAVADVVSMFPMDHATSTKDQHPDARAEVAYAYDPRSGKCRELGVDIGRRYAESGAAEHEIVGTTDVEWTENYPSDMSRISAVRDWKVVFGRGLHIEPVAENVQVLSAAMMAMLVRGHVRARAEIAIIRDDGSCKIHDETVTLRQASMVLRSVLRNIDGADEKTLPRPGRHCIDHYCPMIGICPAVHEAMAACSEAVTQLPVSRMPIVVSPQRIRNDEHAVFLLHLAKQVRHASELVIAACQEYVRRAGHPLDTGNGMEWGPKMTTRTAIASDSVSGLVNVIAPFVGGIEPAKQSVKAGITKQRLEQLVSAASKPKEFKANLQTCTKKLQESDMVVQVSTGERFDERKRKP